MGNMVLRLGPNCNPRELTSGWLVDRVLVAHLTMVSKRFIPCMPASSPSTCSMNTHVYWITDQVWSSLIKSYSTPASLLSSMRVFYVSCPSIASFPKLGFWRGHTPLQSQQPKLAARTAKFGHAKTCKMHQNATELSATESSCCEGGSMRYHSGLRHVHAWWSIFLYVYIITYFYIYFYILIYDFYCFLHGCLICDKPDEDAAFLAFPGWTGGSPVHFHLLPEYPCGVPQQLQRSQTSPRTWGSKAFFKAFIQCIFLFCHLIMSLTALACFGSHWYMNSRLMYSTVFVRTFCARGFLCWSQPKSSMICRLDLKLFDDFMTFCNFLWLSTNSLAAARCSGWQGLGTVRLFLTDQIGTATWELNQAQSCLWQWWK